MPGLVVKPRSRIFHGHDWVYASEVKKSFGNPQPGEVISLKDFKKLGKKLGDLHDLHVLDDFLRQAKKKADDKEPFGHVRQLIGRRESVLVSDCEKRTRNAFGLKPKAFRKALRQALDTGA